MADEVALDSESRVTPLKKEKKKLFNDLVSAKGDILVTFSEVTQMVVQSYESVRLLSSCIANHVLDYM